MFELSAANVASKARFDTALHSFMQIQRFSPSIYFATCVAWVDYRARQISSSVWNIYATICFNSYRTNNWYSTLACMIKNFIQKNQHWQVSILFFSYFLNSILYQYIDIIYMLLFYKIFLKNIKVVSIIDKYRCIIEIFVTSVLFNMSINWSEIILLIFSFDFIYKWARYKKSTNNKCIHIKILFTYKLV